MTALSIIDQGLAVEGDIGAAGMLVIRGTVRGRLQGHHVVIARQGLVNGQVRVHRMDVAGTLEGDIEVDGHVRVLATGRCNGQIRCRTMQMAAGAVIDAAVVCNRGTEEDKVAVEVKAEK